MDGAAKPCHCSTALLEACNVSYCASSATTNPTKGSGASWCCHQLLQCEAILRKCEAILRKSASGDGQCIRPGVCANLAQAVWTTIAATSNNTDITIKGSRTTGRRKGQKS